MDKEVLSEIDESQNERAMELAGKSFYPGYVKSDPLIKHLIVGNSYKAVVKKVDDSSRIIYVSLGKVTGIIPFNYFSWAHERVIDEKKNTFNPSQPLLKF